MIENPCGFKAKCCRIPDERDVVEVVRCKDCKYWRKLLLNHEGCGVCHADNPIRVSNQSWFCADGERRDK